MSEYLETKSRLLWRLIPFQKCLLHIKTTAIPLHTPYYFGPSSRIAPRVISVIRSFVGRDQNYHNKKQWVYTMTWVAAHAESEDVAIIFWFTQIIYKIANICRWENKVSVASATSGETWQLNAISLWWVHFWFFLLG